MVKWRVNVVEKEKKRKKISEFGLPTSFPRNARFASNVLFLAIFDLSHLFLHLPIDVREQS